VSQPPFFVEGTVCAAVFGQVVIPRVKRERFARDCAGEKVWPVTDFWGHEFWTRKRKVQRIDTIATETLACCIENASFLVTGLEKISDRQRRGGAHKQRRVKLTFVVIRATDRGGLGAPP
jgi:hypothetical protein